MGTSARSATSRRPKTSTTKTPTTTAFPTTRIPTTTTMACPTTRTPTMITTVSWTRMRTSTTRCKRVLRLSLHRSNVKYESFQTCKSHIDIHPLSAICNVQALDNFVECLGTYLFEGGTQIHLWIFFKILHHLHPNL